SELGPQYGNGKPEWDNTAVLAEQLKLRAEEAHMLGYDNFAQVSLAPKMAESPAQVMAFLEDLATRARPHAEQDWKELREFAAKELGISDLQPWDMTFAAERLRQQRYSFSENEVKQYFPEDAVFKGLFKVTETLFGVRIRRDEAAVWHPDVRFFRGESGRRPRRAVLPRPVCARRQTRRRLDGRRAWPSQTCARRRANAGCVSHLQLLGAGRRQTGLLHARRSHHAV